LYSAFKALNNRVFYVIVAQTISKLLAFKHCNRIILDTFLHIGSPNYVVGKTNEKINEASLLSSYYHLYVPKTIL